MKPSILALLVLPLLAGTAVAAELSDLRTGTFHGKWCGYTAIYKLKQRQGDKWVFTGKIEFPGYPGEDTFWVEQYEDNSLRMVRTLGPRSGAEGKKQSAQTFPPDLRASEDGSTYAYYKAESHGGIDCEAASDSVNITIPQRKRR